MYTNVHDNFNEFYGEPTGENARLGTFATPRMNHEAEYFHCIKTKNIRIHLHV